MAARPIWKGQLRLSLVSIPVEVYSATKSSAKIRFRQIHEPSGKPIRYEKTVPGMGPVDRDEIVKGFEYDDDSYILLDPDEIDAIKLETKKTMEIVQFVDQGEIPPIYFNKPYYITPADELAEDAYWVVRDALRDSSKTGLCQITMRGKEYLAAIRPCGDGLLMETLHYDEEIREAEPMFSSVGEAEPDAELLDVATSLIDRKTAPFDASSFTNSYEEALRALIDRKLKNKSSKRVEAEDAQPRPQGDNVVDLMSALKESLNEAEPGKKRGKASSKSSSRSGSKSGSSRKSSGASGSRGKKSA